MKLPFKRLNILGDRYQVAAHKPVVEGKEVAGLVEYRVGRIRVNPSQSDDQARDTLLHEVIHAIDNVDALCLSEDQVRRVATGLRAVFTANPEFGKWVCQ